MTRDELNQKVQRYAQVFVSGDLVAADKMHLAEMNIKVILEEAVTPLLAEIERLTVERAALAKSSDYFGAKMGELDKQVQELQARIAPKGDPTSGRICEALKARETD